MPAFHSFSVVAIVLVSCSSSFGYRTRRASIAGYGDPFALTDALQAVDRERRRTNYRLQDILEDDNSYFNPNSVSDLDEDYIRSLLFNLEEEETPSFYEGYNFGDKYDAGSPSYPSSYPGLRDDLYESRKRTAYHPHRVSPNLNQLQNIFGSTNIQRKRMAPSMVDNELGVRQAEDDTRQLANKMDKIARQAEKVSFKEISEQTNDNPPKVIKDIKVEKTNPDGTTKTLEEIFDGANTDTIETDSDNDTEDDTEEETESGNESEIENTEGDDDAGLTKAKRASSEPCAQQSVYIGELLTEIARLRNKLSKLEVEQILEDEENDLLADALGYSTLNQQSGSIRYVEDEYNDIAKATKTEELLQMLADENDEDEEDAYGTAKERLEDFLEPLNGHEQDNDFKKRSDVPDLQWYTHPVIESANGATMADEDSLEDGINDSFVVGDDSPELGPYDGDEDVDEDVEAIKAVEEALEEQEEEDEENEAEEEAEKEVLESAVAEVENEIEQEKQEAEKVEMLKNVLQGLSPDELKDLIEGLEQGQAIEEARSQVSLTCPAVEELSDNCAFADAVGLPIDTDARELCVRHQLCSACGTQLGISKSNCDRGYKGTVIAECEGDSECLKSAAMFLKLMNQYHSYSIYGPEQCAAPCIEAFIVGED